MTEILCIGLTDISEVKDGVTVRLIDAVEESLASLDTLAAEEYDADPV